MNYVEPNRGWKPLLLWSLSFHTPSAETSTAKVRRADALVLLADSRCEGYEITLHVPAGTCQSANTFESGFTIPVAAAERLCCDAKIIPVIEGEAGEILDIGRKTRISTPAISRALYARDKGGCRFPGCTHTQHLQGHHIQHWAYGGKTCLDNEDGNSTSGCKNWQLFT